MAFTLPSILGFGGPSRRILLTALLCLTAVVLLAACGDGNGPAAGTPPVATPEQSGSPVPAATAAPTATPGQSASPVPAATAVPTATLEPAATPVSTPTPERTASSVGGEFRVELTPETRWQDLLDAFTESEQECIRAELGAELVETVSQELVIPEGRRSRGSRWCSAACPRERQWSLCCRPSPSGDGRTERGGAGVPAASPVRGSMSP